MEQPIDFVATRVDGQDEAWRRERARYCPEAGTDHDECRCRDWASCGEFRRRVERFMESFNSPLEDFELLLLQSETY